MKMTESIENYLETVYILSKNRGFARVKDISNYMNVTKPSVSNALSELKKIELINQEKYGYIELTEKGKKKAQSIAKKHSILKNFLITVLDVNEETADSEACSMEHVLSKDTINKIEKYTAEKTATQK